jgi:thioredoxin reductase (NADPH)
MQKNLVIIGSGPAAWTAAIYAARARLIPCVFTGFKMGGKRGGQLMLTTEVENFPGYPIGILGGELVRLMEEQARRFDIEVYEEDVHGIEICGDLFAVRGNNNTIQTRSVIIATGANAKRLTGVKGDDRLWMKGVSACAVCDGAAPIFRNQELLVVGGGDSACEEAMFLTKYGKKVYLVHRRDKFRASKIMLERVLKNPKIEIVYNHVVEEIYGDVKVEGVKLQSVETQAIKDIPVKGVFYGIGHEPNTQFLNGIIELDETGYIVNEVGGTKTSVPGIFGAGDVCDKRYKQAVTAAAMGCMAALDVEKYLSEKDILG